MAVTLLPEVGWLVRPQKRRWGPGNHTFWARKEAAGEDA